MLTSTFWESLSEEDKTDLIVNVLRHVIKDLKKDTSTVQFVSTDRGLKPIEGSTGGIQVKAISQAITATFQNITASQDLMNSFDARLTSIVGNPQLADKEAFENLGSNLIQAVARLSKGVISKGSGFTHKQDEASTRWVITHNLNKAYVNYALYDTNLDRIRGTENRVDSTSNCLIIDFDLPIDGIAIIDI